jgi:hypothetical protein
MEAEKIQDIMNKLASLYALGSEEAAQAYLDEVYPTLPESVQGEIALATFTRAMKKETAERDAIADIQEEGMAVAEALQKIKDEIS